MEEKTVLEIALYQIRLAGGACAVLFDRRAAKIPKGWKLGKESLFRAKAGKIVECRHYRICNDFAAEPKIFKFENTSGSTAKNLPFTIRDWSCGYCPLAAEALRQIRRRDWIDDQDGEYHFFALKGDKRAAIEKLELVLQEKNCLVPGPKPKPKPAEDRELPPMSIAPDRPDFSDYEIIGPDGNIFSLFALKQAAAIKTVGERLEGDKIDYRLFRVGPDGVKTEIDYKFIYFLWRHAGSEQIKGGREISFFELHHQGRAYSLGPRKNKKTLYQEIQKIIGRDSRAARLYAIQAKDKINLNLCDFDHYIAKFFVIINRIKYPLRVISKEDAIKSALKMAAVVGCKSPLEFAEKTPKGEWKKEFIS